MSQTFGDLELAAKTKEVISTLVRKEVDKLRPAPRYATVDSLDPLTVTYSGDPTSMPVRTGSVVPSAVGQIVRIEGPPNDRYVADVVGVVDESVPPYEPGGSNEFPDGIEVGDGQGGSVIIDSSPPDDVTGLTVTQGLEFENIYFMVEWDLVENAVEYEIEVAEKLGANVYDLARVARTSALTARIDGLQPYTEYGVRVAAISNIGLRSVVTPWLDVLTTGDNTIPPQVTAPTLSRGATSLIVSYPPLDALDAPDVANGNGLYEVQIDTVNTFDGAELRSNLTTSSIVAFSDLIFTATWYARVRAIDTSGNLGAWSNIASLVAGQITTSHIGDNQITSEKIVTAGLDAAVIKFGTMSGDRITANTMSVDKLTSSTLTAKTITLGAGGQIRIGNPTTNGIYINDQGIRAYSGGSTTFHIDSSGNATFSGTISGATITGTVISGGTLQSSGWTGNVNNGGWSIINGGTAWFGGTLYTREVRVAGGANLFVESGIIYVNEVRSYSANTLTLWNNLAISSSSVSMNCPLSVAGGVTISGVYDGAALDVNEIRGSVTFQPGAYNRIVADPNNRSGAWYVYCPSHIYATSGSGFTVVCDSGTGRLYLNTSTIKIKQNVTNLEHSTSSKVLQLQARQWYPRTDQEQLTYNDKMHIKHRYKHTGFVAEEVHAIHPGFALVDGKGEPVGIDWQAITGMLVEEVKKLREEMDALIGAGV